MHAVPHRREPAQGGARAAVDRLHGGHRRIRTPRVPKIAKLSCGIWIMFRILRWT